MYRPLPLESIALDQPVPVNIWDPKGVLLLRKGEIIATEKHRGQILLHGPVVLASDWQAVEYAYASAIDRLVRGNESLSRIAEVKTLGHSVETNAAQTELPATEAWPDLQASLATLLLQTGDPTQFLDRLERIHARADKLWHEQPDNSLLVLVQLLLDAGLSYSATHALLTAGLCALVAPHADLDADTRRSLGLAALTMNMGMNRAHNQMARQPGALDAAQRKTVREHPHRSAALLRALGVDDPLWLQLVEQHHERVDGTGYPAGLRIDNPAHRLLQLADTYVACISPRESRGAQLSQDVARQLYLGFDQLPDRLGALFVKRIGFFMPGTCVGLVNGERGVVVRRGAKANSPKVVSLVGRLGHPLGEPVLRDTAHPEFAVQASLPAGELKVVVNVAKLIARC